MKIFCLNCKQAIKFVDSELVHVETGSALCYPMNESRSMMVAEALDPEDMEEWMKKHKEE